MVKVIVDKLVRVVLNLHKVFEIVATDTKWRRYTEDVLHKLDMTLEALIQLSMLNNDALVLCRQELSLIEIQLHYIIRTIQVAFENVYENMDEHLPGMRQLVDCADELGLYIVQM